MLVVGLSALADEGRRLAVVCGGGRGIAADLVDMAEALDAVARIGEAMQEFLAELLGFVQAPLVNQVQNPIGEPLELLEVIEDERGWKAGRLRISLPR